MAMILPQLEQAYATYQAYAAYQAWVAEQGPEPELIDGLSSEQLFFALPS